MQQHLSMSRFLDRCFGHLDLMIRRHLQRWIAFVSHDCQTYSWLAVPVEWLISNSFGLSVRQAVSATIQKVLHILPCRLALSSYVVVVTKKVLRIAVTALESASFGKLMVAPSAGI